MKKQMNGIALILLGILLNVVSVALSGYLPGDYALLPCVFGIAAGAFGAALVFSGNS